jgi:cytidylate kinase
VADRQDVIAIDGPAASGKSTTAAAVARELGALHLDSGALYRVLTAVALAPRQTDPEQLLQSAESRGLELREAGGALVPFLDDRDAEPLLRTAEVNALVSEVSAWPAVREWVNSRLRSAAARVRGRPLVLDGRDIGTVVFPHAPVKVFLTATPEARARRRLLQRGDDPDEAEVAREAALLAERDRRDAVRPVAPLRRAADAVLLDTTALDFAEQVGEIVRLARRNLPGL